MLMTTTYRFSIFLPVRNGGHYFRKCVLSILAQTYRNFDLIVLDNASTDGSLEWIRKLKDLRVTVYMSEKSLSIEDNWARIMLAQKNEFMTITGHDDLFDPDYLENMCQLIERNPDAGLYQTHFRLINAEGKRIRSCTAMPLVESIGEFVASRLSFLRDSFGTGYMFRSADYESVGGIPSYKKLMFADDALWVQLMQSSYKATSDKECFSYRVHSQSTSHSPDWESTYQALDCYVTLLELISQKETGVANALAGNMKGYFIFWYQWAYFSSLKNDEQEKLINAIHISALHIGGILKKLGVEDADKFESDVRKHVFSCISRYYWFFNRLRRWSANNISPKLIGLHLA